MYHPVGETTTHTLWYRCTSVTFVPTVCIRIRPNYFSQLLRFALFRVRVRVLLFVHPLRDCMLSIFCQELRPRYFSWTLITSVILCRLWTVHDTWTCSPPHALLVGIVEKRNTLGIIITWWSTNISERPVLVRTPDIFALVFVLSPIRKPTWSYPTADMYTPYEITLHNEE